MSTQVVSEKTYADAVDRGHYDRYVGGLHGKHDNVRTYWEDQIRNVKLRPHLQRLVTRKKRAGERLRIADLGAGTGQGYELLTAIVRDESDLKLDQVRVLPPELVEMYVGCDLSDAMVTQGNLAYEDEPNMVFRVGDFSEGFPLADEKPFDLYFCSYGSLSHIDDEAMEQLFMEIAAHVKGRAIVVGDWLGRHSIEWPCYWDERPEEMQDYSMSWLTPGDTPPEDVEHFPMRLWLGDEIQALAAGVGRKLGVKFNVLDLYDCSIFVGRHVDTAEYNDCLRPTRAAVNRLHEANLRTDLERLKVELVPVPGHDELNGYFGKLQFCWNALVDYCQRRLERRVSLVRMKNWASFSPALQIALMALDRVIDTVSWMRMGDPRANIIEPQLGYSLRSLEAELQEGKGRGHGLVGIFEVRKG